MYEEMNPTINVDAETVKHGPHGELFFFLIEQELVVASDVVSSNLFVSSRRRSGVQW